MNVRYEIRPVPMEPAPKPGTESMGIRVRYEIIKPILSVFFVVFHDSWTNLTRDFGDFCVGEQTCATRALCTAERSRRPIFWGFFPFPGPFWASFPSPSRLHPKSTVYRRYFHKHHVIMMQAYGIPSKRGGALANEVAQEGYMFRLAA